MFDDFDRYAVYWVPRRPDPLAPFGSAWTGWCAEDGEHRARSQFDDRFPDLAEITRELCRHGLHGIITAPFRLAPGRSRFSVEHVLDAIVEEAVSFRLPRFELAVVDGRVALVPQQSSGALAALITRVTDALAPLIARATPQGFAEAPAHGKPDGAVVPFGPVAQHRFHVPLTDAQPLERAHALKAALAPLVEPLLGAPRGVSEVALMGDPGGGRPLRVLQSYALLDWPLRPGARALPSHGPQVFAPMPAPRRKADIAV